jgi:hypothetical protein
MLQYTDKSPKAHAISVSAFEKVLEGLSLFDEAKDYTVVLILTMPAYREVADSTYSGIHFKEGKDGIFPLTKLSEKLRTKIAGCYVSLVAVTEAALFPF